MDTPSSKRSLFSDVDGTLTFVEGIHAIRWVKDVGGGRVLAEDIETGQRFEAWDVSTSGYRIFLAEETRRLCHALRDRFNVVLVTGGRPATVAKRRHVLDFAHAVICENGGVILDADLRPDAEWHERLAPERRALPAVAAYLHGQGWKLDSDGRSSALRVRFRDNAHKDRDAFAVLCRDLVLPPELKKTRNLDNLDIILAGAGKDQAVRFLLKRWGQAAGESVAIGDDTNDIELLRLVGAPRVLASAFPPLLDEARRRGWPISKARHFDGIAEVLKALLS